MPKNLCRPYQPQKSANPYGSLDFGVQKTVQARKPLPCMALEDLAVYGFLDSCE